MDILATHISNSGPEFHYILRNDAFSSARILSDDVLESLSIGEIGVLYEYCVAHADSTSRKDNGQYFTPDDVANLMVEQTKRFKPGIWLDPCSGIGNLSWHLVNAQMDKEEFLLNKMILSDKDNLALLIARTLFTLSFQEKHSFLFDEIESRFVNFDFLSVSEESNLISTPRESLESIPKHDYVIVNPPYLSIGGEDSRFETAKARDLYAYFLENIIKTSKGFVSITPQSFTNASKFRSLRALLLEKYSSLKIYAFDNIPGNIFYGVKFGSNNSNTSNSMRAAIMVADCDTSGYQISSLLRWRSSERDVFFANLDAFLSQIEFTAEYFPKVSSIFKDLYEEVEYFPKLKSMTALRPTDFVLYVPASPRYFISALKKPVSRTSLKTLYFHSQRDLDKAYLLLNSSFMYWWWRVRDGGMTLSLETLLSTPIPKFRLSMKLVRMLENSETSNMVYKMNAGALHENVKHDKSLISLINDCVSPAYSKRLLLTHENSELVQLPGLGVFLDS